MSHAGPRAIHVAALSVLLAQAPISHVGFVERFQPGFDGLGFAEEHDHVGVDLIPQPSEDFRTLGGFGVLVELLKVEEEAGDFLHLRLDCAGLFEEFGEVSLVGGVELPHLHIGEILHRLFLQIHIT